MPLWWTLGKLKSKDSRTRIATAESLGDVRDPRATKALLETALGDTDALVREGAAKSLGKHGDPEVVEIGLQLLVHESSDARARGLEILQHAGELALRPLIAAVGHADPVIVVNAIQALGYIGDERAIPVIVKVAREHAQSYDQFRSKIGPAATEALKGIGGQTGIRELILLYPDSKGSEQCDIIRALSDIDEDWRNSDGADEAVDILLRDKDVTLHIDILTRIGDRRALESLIAEIGRPERSAAVLRALDELDPNWWQSPRANARIPQLIRLLSGGPEERYLAADLLGKMKVEQSIPELVRAMADVSGKEREDWIHDPRKAAERALDAIDPDWPGREDVRAAVPALISSLGEGPERRRAAAEALERIGDRRAVEPLATLYLSGEEGARHALLALDKIDTAWAKSMLDPVIAAFESGKIDQLPNEPDLLPLVLPMLEDSRLRLRLTAGRMVSEWMGDDARGHLATWKDDPEFIIRWSAMYLLREGEHEDHHYLGDGHLFCFRCGAEMAAGRPGAAWIDLCDGDEELAWRGMALDGALCAHCDRLWCRSCVAFADDTSHIPECPVCSGPMNGAGVGNTRPLLRYGF